MSTHYTLAQPCRVEPLINNDELIRNGAPGGRNPDGTFAPGNRDSWKHGASSRQTRRALVEDSEAASALADHCPCQKPHPHGSGSRSRVPMTGDHILREHLGRAVHSRWRPSDVPPAAASACTVFRRRT